MIHAYKNSPTGWLGSFHILPAILAFRKALALGFRYAHYTGINHIAAIRVCVVPVTGLGNPNQLSGFAAIDTSTVLILTGQNFALIFAADLAMFGLLASCIYPLMA